MSTLAFLGDIVFIEFNCVILCFDLMYNDSVLFQMFERCSMAYCCMLMCAETSQLMQPGFLVFGAVFWNLLNVLYLLFVSKIVVFRLCVYVFGLNHVCFGHS